nr:MAG TPA: hypothetical protein [Caudoviricetes sp.]
MCFARKVSTFSLYIDCNRNLSYRQGLRAVKYT